MTTDDIFNLILTKHEEFRAASMSRYNSLNEWLLIISSRTGELANQMLPLVNLQIPERWNREMVEHYKQRHSEALVAATELATTVVQSCEWLSNKLGFGNTPEQILKRSNSPYRWSDGDPVHAFHSLYGSLFSIGFDITENKRSGWETASYHLRDMVFYVCNLIYRLQKNRELTK